MENFQGIFFIFHLENRFDNAKKFLNWEIKHLCLIYWNEIEMSLECDIAKKRKDRRRKL